MVIYKNNFPNLERKRPDRRLSFYANTIEILGYLNLVMCTCFLKSLTSAMGVGRGAGGDLSPLDFETFSKKGLFF